MNILTLVKEFPHSKVIGGPITVYNRIKYLSENNEVSLLSFGDTTDQQYLPSLAPYCEHIEIIPHPEKRRPLRWMRDYLFSTVAPYFLLGYSPLMENRFEAMVQEEQYHVVISEYSVMAQYLYNKPYLEGTMRVMFVHECYYLSRRLAWKVQGFNRRGLTALLYTKGLKDYELSLYRSADLLLTLTPEDKDKLLQLDPRLNIEVVPSGIDVEYFCPPRETPHSPKLMFLGNYPHYPNRDAVLFFLESIWPPIKKEMPGTKFYVVGRDPTPDILKAAREDPQVIVTGTVEDVRPYFAKSQVFVCPIRMGGGLRGKLLESMAMGVPVVSTSLGAEGIPGQQGENILIANNPHDFTSHIVELLKNQSLREKISRNARSLVVDEFSCEKVVRRLEVLLEAFNEKHST